MNTTSGDTVRTTTSGDAVRVAIPAKPEYLHIVRTVVGSVAARRDLTIDAIEDLRIAVDEACAQLLGAGGSTITIEMTDLGAELETRCTTDARDHPWPPEGLDRSLAAQVLRGLTDGVAWERTPAGPSVRISKRGVGATGA